MSETRQQALKALKRHKSGWIRLGEALLKIKESDEWKDWGYSKFWDYTKEELGLTTMTAKEMMDAFVYVRDHEPASLNSMDPDTSNIPDYHTLATLSKAVNKNKIDDEKEDRVRDILFNADDENMVKSNKEAKDILSEAFGKSGEEIMEDIGKKTKSIQKRMKKLNGEIHSTSSFDNDIMDTSDKLTDMISKVSL